LELLKKLEAIMRIDKLACVGLVAMVALAANLQPANATEYNDIMRRMNRRAVSGNFRSNYTALGNKLCFSTLNQEKIPAPMWDTLRGRALARPTKATCLGNPGNSYIQVLIFPIIPYSRMPRQVKKSQKLKSSPRTVYLVRRLDNMDRHLNNMIAARGGTRWF
jgi:hypothetical protein